MIIICNPEIITHEKLLVWQNKFEKCKAFKKELSKELRPGIQQDGGIGVCLKMRKKE